MRVLYLDIDTLRPDHLGCYGYRRATSPNIDRIAAEGVRFDNCYASDAPCLPSRGAMFTGMFGIHSGIVGHGGTAADLRLVGRERGFGTQSQQPMFVQQLASKGYHTISVSPFAFRHSAWWFYAGWREMINTGKGGGETADMIVPHALEWLKGNARRDDWLLHVNVWDPHTNYRTPAEFGDRFADEPLDDWYSEELRQRQWADFGPGSPQEPGGGFGRFAGTPRQPARIASMADYKRCIDSYDLGIRYADEWCGRILNALADQGVLDETIVMITSDHGENFGELNVFSDHATADHITSRVPMILRHPGCPGRRVDAGLYYQCDLSATLTDLLTEKTFPSWDGRSFAPAFKTGKSAGRDSLVVSQNAWSCQRSVRWGDHIFIRSYHTGLKHYPARMLFNLKDDPHETRDLVAAQPALADRGQALLESWTAAMMTASSSAIDPMWTVMREGGPFHTRGQLENYCKRLRETGRAQHADFLERNPAGLAG